MVSSMKLMSYGSCLEEGCRIDPTVSDKHLAIGYDICVVGSGAAVSVIAYELIPEVNVRSRPFCKRH